MRIAKGFPIPTRLFVVSTTDINACIGREINPAKIFVRTRQTRKVFVAICGQFKRFVVDLKSHGRVFPPRRVSTTGIAKFLAGYRGFVKVRRWTKKKAVEPLKGIRLFPVVKLYPPKVWRLRRWLSDPTDRTEYRRLVLSLRTSGQWSIEGIFR
jgi:hypothetical protein